MLQNADDNTYDDGVVPELEFVLVDADVASVGVQWTLLVLNNEVGFSPANILSLCSIGRSTKSGKRDSGYIGEKGIGFKSVFLVTKQPLVISNGFRIRFNEAPSAGTELGYIVPEWAEEPTDAHLLDCLGIHELPNTVIVLPIRPEKVQTMREQLFQLSPQLVLFLRKIEKLAVRQLTNPPKTMAVRRHTMSTPRQLAIPNNCSYSLVRLSFADTEAAYHIWQQEFPVDPNHEVDHRRDVQSWIITLAFPIQKDRYTQNDQYGANAAQPDIYAFLPTKLTAGFPFLINADFLLVSSRESMRFDSEWNKGILSCIPQAFMDAFLSFLKAAVCVNLGPLTPLRHVYSYVPYKKILVRELGVVRDAIIEHMKTQATILCDAKLGQQFPAVGGMASSSNTVESPPFFCCPSVARLIHSKFREVLEKAHKANVPPPKLLTSQRVHVVDAELAKEHSSMLLTLQVQSCTEKDYIECLRSPDWLKSLSEPLYVKVLDWVSRHVVSKALYADVPLVKYLDAGGETRMLAAQDKDSIPVYMSKMSKDEHFLSNWRPIFQRWVSVHFMPRKTVQAIQGLREGGDRSLYIWLHEIANVAVLSVQSYGETLARRCEKIPHETDLALGVMHFFLHATQDGYVELPQCKSIVSKLPLIDRSGKVVRGLSNHILLPGSVCTWPRVLLHDSWQGHVLCLSEKYLELPPSISDEIEPSSVIHFLKKAVDAVDIFDITSPPDAPLYTGAPWGQRAEDVKSFLAWIKSLPFIPRRLKVSLQGSDWVKTVDHGKKPPARCFLDSAHWHPRLHKGDVPFINLGFYGDLWQYSSILHVLGVVVNIGDGAGAVAEHVCELSKASCAEIQTDTAIRWYTYLRLQNWVGWATGSSRSQKLIWVPGCYNDGRSRSLGSWRSSEECVISDSGGLFSNRLVVLNRFYKDQDVLMFFEHNMGVAPTPGTEKYCQLWVDWGEDGRRVSKEACENAWRIIAQGWGSCARSNSCEVQSFKKRCRIPCAKSSMMDTDTMELARPEDVLHVDNLALAEVFSEVDPGPRFAWYPIAAAAASWVEDLVRCYTDLGVKKLSDALEGGSSAGYSSKIGISQATGSGSCRGRIGKGIVRAILGYLADVKHGILAPVRKRMVMQLQNVEVWQVGEVGEVKYRVMAGGSVYEASRSAHVIWEKGQKRIYMAMPRGSNKVMVAHELAVEVAKGVLGGERLALVHGLQEWLLLAAGFAFDDDAMKELLRLRNLRLNLEDEALLMNFPNLSFSVDGVLAIRA